MDCRYNDKSMLHPVSCCNLQLTAVTFRQFAPRWVWSSSGETQNCHTPWLPMTLTTMSEISNGVKIKVDGSQQKVSNGTTNQVCMRSGSLLKKPICLYMHGCILRNEWLIQNQCFGIWTKVARLSNLLTSACTMSKVCLFALQIESFAIPN